MPDADESRTSVLEVVDAHTEAVLCRLEVDRTDLALVEALARLQLAARRRGTRVRVRGAEPELLALLELVGLGDVLAGQALGQPEGREQLRTEEVVQAVDPPA